MKKTKMLMAFVGLCEWFQAHAGAIESCLLVHSPDLILLPKEHLWLMALNQSGVNYRPYTLWRAGSQLGYFGLTMPLYEYLKDQIPVEWQI
jgi:hypothetical protein